MLQNIFLNSSVIPIFHIVAEPKLFIFDSGSFLAPPLSLFSAPAPALAIYYPLKLYYNSTVVGTIRNKSQEVFLHPTESSILKTDCRIYLLNSNFGSTGSGSATLIFPNLLYISDMPTYFSFPLECFNKSQGSNYFIFFHGLIITFPFNNIL